jgi:cytochrome c biogenesis protein CcdA
LLVQAVFFCAGVASTLSVLGVASSSLGKAYGQVGGGLLPSVAALVAIAMGLQLLEVRQGCAC